MKKILILGAEGFIGSELYKKIKSKKGFHVEGTSRNKKKGYLFLDIEKEETFSEINFKKYDIIYYCIGKVDYGFSMSSLLSNVRINFIGALKVIDKLDSNQKFIYLSTHIVKLPIEDQNVYSFSKLLFENSIKILKNYNNVKIVRIPGVFSSSRKNGLMHHLKKSFIEKKEFKLDFVPKKWHIMELGRVSDILLIFLNRKIRETFLDIGYPLKIDIEIIYNSFNKFFRRNIPFKSKNYKKDDYVPNLKALTKYYPIKKEDFYEDIKNYLEAF